MMSAPAGTSRRVGRKVAGGRTLVLLLWVMGVVVAAAGVGWACRTPGAGGGTAPGAAGPPDVGAEAGGAERAGARAAAAGLHTTLTPKGFEPARVGRAAGRFNLRVKNRSGEREVVLRLTDAGGSKVTEARLTDQVQEWAVPVELAAGSYVLTEANHPEWTCRIEVTAQ